MAIDHIEELKRIFSVAGENFSLRKVIISKLADEGRLARQDITQCFSNPANIDQMDEAMVALIYINIFNAKVLTGLPKPSYYFRDATLRDAETLTKRDIKDGFPLVFHHAIPLTPDGKEFLCAVSLQDLTDMSLTKTMRILGNIQRESSTTRLGDEDIPVVSYDLDKVKEIKENLLVGAQHPNAIRLHLLDNESGVNACSYDPNTGDLTLRAGILANIDGNHRINAAVEACAQNPAIGKAYKMPVIITIGPARMAKDIIIQEEKRTPIKQSHIASMVDNSCIRIVNAVIPNVASYYKTCTTLEQSRAGGGILVTYLFADAIHRAFNIDDQKKVSISPMREKQLAEYLSNFLSEYGYLIDGKLPGCLSRYMTYQKKYVTDPYMIYGVMELAARFEKKDWPSLLSQTVSNLNVQQNIVTPQWDNISRSVIKFFLDACPEEIKTEVR